ncbi:F-box/LRR-repeat protein [Cocos nucifera]|uniref:F-box/LRR-repeat protein n=1 Tax=Cocos nucifera TaxID=13894 RepID=A0A8K0N4F1_COCNU|nr:F-box/LRR-repeat protein [Cocos nucifera]
MAGGRRWEAMGLDCLVNIFQRLGIEDLALGVPFACKSWYRASLDPICWRVLNFQALDFMPWSNFSKRFMRQYSLQHFSFSGFMKLAIDRSHGGVVELRFPLLIGASLRDLVHASNMCPRLKIAVLPKIMLEDEEHIPELVGKWKDLERLEMESKPSSFSEIATQVGLNCKSFTGLRMFGAIKKEDVLAITKSLPKIRNLCLSGSYLCKKELLAMVDGCKELEKLIVNDCIGFEADEEVLKRASAITTFEHEGSKLYDDFGYDTDECDLHHVRVI